MYNIKNFNARKVSKKRIQIYNGFKKTGAIIKSNRGGYVAIKGFKKTRFRTKKGAITYIIASKYTKKR